MRLAGLIAAVLALSCASSARASLATALVDPVSSPLFASRGVLERSPLGPEREIVFPAGNAIASAEAFLMSPAPEDGGLLAQRAIRGDREKPSAAATMRVASRPRNPGKAALFSAIVPGSGELYQGSKRGFVFLGVEAVSWYAYFSFRSSGLDKDAEFRRFAGDIHDPNAHWNIFRLEEAVSDSDCTSVVSQDDIDRLEQFWLENKQHYYEDVGKLETYACGWDNPANRDAYRAIRRESNRLLTNSRRAKTIAFMNHIASAVDAFLMARQYNRSLGQGISMKFDLVANVQNPRAKVTFTRRFY